MEQTKPTPFSTSMVESAGPRRAGSASEHTSHLTAVLDAAWGELREIILGLPPAILLMLSARDYKRRGHFAGEAWRKRHEEGVLHEVAVHPGMFESPEDLLITILHEAAHALLWEQWKDRDKHCCGVSLAGYYHRKEFRDAAADLGLGVHFVNRRYGFSHTLWPAAGVPEKYHGVLKILGEFAVVASKRLPARPALRVAKKQVSWIALACHCFPARILHCPPVELHGGGIFCERCGDRFRPQL